MWCLCAQVNGIRCLAEGVFCRPHAKLTPTLAFRRLSILAFPSLNPTGRFLCPRVCFFRPLPTIEIYANTNPYDKLSSPMIAWNHTRLDTPAPFPITTTAAIMSPCPHARRGAHLEGRSKTPVLPDARIMTHTTQKGIMFFLVDLKIALDSNAMVDIVLRISVLPSADG